MTTFTQLTPAPSDPPKPFTDRLRLAVAAYLTRFKGSSREHTESDLRCYLSWCAERGLDPLTLPAAPHATPRAMTTTILCGWLSRSVKRISQLCQANSLTDISSREQVSVCGSGRGTFPPQTAVFWASRGPRSSMSMARTGPAAGLRPGCPGGGSTHPPRNKPIRFIYYNQKEPDRMEFEFDPAKSASNLDKHGIDFGTVQAIWQDVMRVE
ncbi:MAG: hypothetical protein ACLPKE_22570, partial [Streptosporangiaceae bacterium]